ncbi:MAG: GGDEF domain-containing protein, partial [Lachnospiraceae bacterium]|nr:GGDEF domain-containing protein [Lachnospiraceae bacterium]
LVNVFCYINENVKLLIVLHKLHLAGYSTIEFICKYIKNKTNAKVGMFATYNEAFQINPYVKLLWNRLIVYMENNNLLYDCATNIKDKDEYSEDIFNPNPSDVNDYVVKINNMIHTFALEQASYYMDIIHQKIEFENLNVDNWSKEQLYYRYSLLNLYNGTYNDAMLMCENLKDLIKKDYTPKKKFFVEYLEGIIFVYMSQIKFAKKCVANLTKLAYEIDEEFFYFKIELLNHYIIYFGWTDMYSFGLTFVADEKFLDDCLKYGYKNTLSHMYINGVDGKKNSEIVLPEVFEDLYIPPNMKKGIKLIKEIGNDGLLTSAYMNTIDFYKGLNNFKYIERIYRECINIKKDEDNKSELANLYNGIGYNCSIVEKYNQANEYYNEALNIFYEENLPEQMGETVYNMAFNCMLAGDYKSAYDFTYLSIGILEELKIQGFRMCKKSKLYGFAAFCNYYLGADYNCYMYLSKMERVLNHILKAEDIDDNTYDAWADDLFLYYFVSGLISMKNGEYKTAEDYFSKAYNMIKSFAFKIFSYPHLAIEQANLYRILDKEDVAVGILGEAIDYCAKNGYFEMQKKLMTVMKNSKNVDIVRNGDYGLKGITAENIIENTHDYAIELELNNRLNDVNFMVRWQDRLDRENEELDLMLYNSMKTIQNNFGFDQVIYLKMKDERLEVEYNSIDEEISSINIEIISNYFENNKASFITNRFDKYFTEYKELLDVFNEDNIVILAGIPIINNEKIDSVLIGILYMHRNVFANRRLLDDSKLIIIKYVFGQLVDAVERLTYSNELKVMNDKLKVIATTDLLTGLLNRQGFMEIIANCKEEDNSDINSILYIDLDNFKYYNDTVGHEMGDLVLVLFADILKQCACDNGFVVRYGGDEFVLMVRNTNTDKAVSIAKDIYVKIQSGFIKEIEQKLNKEVTISDDKKISCCIGIADFKGYDSESIEDALNRADEALYYVKNTTKHDYKVSALYS